MTYGELKNTNLFMLHPTRIYNINGDNVGQYVVENIISKFENLDDYLVIGTGTGSGDWIEIDMVKC